MSDGAGRSVGCSIWARLVVAAFALIQACSAQHGPQSADTATSWLRACVEDSECGGGGVCLNHLCSIGCTNDRSCGEFAPGAFCAGALGDRPQRACDLACEQPSDCAGLGEDYDCQSHRCRLHVPVAVVASDLDLEPMQGTPWWWQAADPVVSWTGKEWRALQVMRPEGDGESGDVLKIAGRARVEAGGRNLFADYGMRDVPVAEWDVPVRGEPRALAPDGTVATVYAAADPTTVTKELVQLVPSDDGETRELECPGRFALLPLLGNEWLISCEESDGSVSLGRYEPHSGSWSLTPSTVLRERAPTESVKFALHGEDDVLLFLEDTAGKSRMALLAGAAGTPPTPFAQPLTWHEVDVTALSTTRGHFDSPAPSGGWLVPRWFERNTYEGTHPTHHPWVTPSDQIRVPTGYPIAADGSIGAPVRFPLSTTWNVSLHAAEGVPETGQIAFCYQEDRYTYGDEGGMFRDLLFAVFDRDGQRVAGPLRLKTSSNLLSSCRISWSGSSFLVIWNQWTNLSMGPTLLTATLLTPE